MASHLHQARALTDNGIGSFPNVAGLGVPVLSRREGGMDFFHRARVPFTDLSIAIADSGGANGGFGGQKLYDLPATGLWGLIAMLNLSAIAAGAGGIGDTATVKTALGTTLEGTNDTLDSVQANIIASGNNLLAGGIGPAAQHVGGLVVFNGISSAPDLFLNLGVANAEISAADVVVVSGWLDLVYFLCGSTRAEEA